MGKAGLLPGASGEEYTSKLVQVVDRIQFSMAVELRSLILCWLPAGGHLQFLEATHIPWHMSPPSSELATTC